MNNLKDKISNGVKIAICINGRPHEGGTTTLINNLVDGLKALGHESDVISIFGKSEYRQIKRNLTKHVDKALKDKPILTWLAYLVSKVILAGHIYLNYFINRYDAIWAIDMSVANVAHPLKLLTKIIIVNIPIGENVPGLVDQGKIKRDTWIEKYIENEERKALVRSDLNICPSIHLKYIKKIAPNHAPLFYIPTPVNINLFHPDAEERKKQRNLLGIQPETFVILSVSRLAPRKGVRYSIMALKEIMARDEDKNYLLIYVGGGPEKVWLEQFRDQHGLQPYVKFVGRVDHSQTVDFFRAADCFVFCSTGEGGYVESHSHSPVEAMACGTPIVAFDIFNPDEPESERVFYHEQNCLLVPEKDVSALARAIKRIKNDSSIREKIIQGGPNHLKEKDQIPELVVKKMINQMSNVL